MVLRPEDFDSRFAALASSLDDLAVDVLGDDLATGGGKSELAADTQGNLRAYLEDEIVAAVEQQGDLGIRDTEAGHEQIKRALAHLKLSVLRDIAHQRGVYAGGNLDRVTGHVASALDWNREAIARLILDHTEETPEVATGHSTRIFTVREALALDEVVQRLSYVSGRYIRTGIARWFVFYSSRRVDPILRLEGAVDAYRAEAREVDDAAFLDATPTSADVEVDLLSDSNVLLIHNASAQDARGSLVALKAAAKVDVRDYVPRAEINVPIMRRTIHPTSSLMLDLVYSRLRGSLFRDRNPVLARFRFSKAGADGEGAARKPKLRAVRFDGEHLLDSREACSLLWLEGRPLVDLTLRVHAHDDQGQSMGRFNVRITIENDHVAVATGYGSAPIEHSLELHRASVAAVQRAMIGPEPDLERLKAVESHIRQVATSDSAPETAELLRDLDGD
jgi:hypothetical protein